MANLDNTNPLFRPFLSPAAAVPALGTNIAMPSSAPSIAGPSPQTQSDSMERSRLVSTGSGIDQIKNPLLKGIARAGDIAASVFAPNVAQFIPGTTLHHNMLVNQATRNVDKDQAQENMQVGIRQKQALTKQEEARADAYADPRKAVDPSKTVQTDNGVFQLNPDTGKYDIRVGDRAEKPRTIEEQAYDYAVSQGKNPLDAYGAVYGVKNQKDSSLPQQYLDAIATGDTVKADLIKRTIQETQTQPKIDVHAAGDRPPRQMVFVDDGNGGQRAVEVTPGMTIPGGASKSPGGPKISSDEQKRADLAQNLNENIDSLEDIAKRRPELFGPLAGRYTELRNKIGTSDPDITKLEAIRHNLGMVSQGAHGMRSAEGVERSANSLLNGFHNSAEATAQGLEAARQSVQTFLNNSQNPGKPRTVESTIKAGDIRPGNDGNYRFKGGDQYDRNNWEKVNK